MEPSWTERPRAEARSEAGRIARAAGVVSAATALSRVLGFVRDMVTAAYFGAGGAMDAFLVAFRLPNLLRSLFAEGSLTVAFAPVFVATLEKEGRGRADRLGQTALTLLGTVLALACAGGVLAAPVLVRLLAWGFAGDAEKLALTVSLTRVVFPYLGLIGLTALAGSLLNAYGDFASPALAPVVLNVGVILGTVGLYRFAEPPIRGVAYGVLLGGAGQLLLQCRALRRAGFVFRPDFHWRDEALRRVFVLLGPRVFGVAVYQVNAFVSTILATRLPEGSVSYLYYAERLFQLPLGVFAVSVGTASLPSLSRLAARRDSQGLRETLAEALRLTAFIVIPASVGLLVLAEPILSVLLRRGSFGAAEAHATAQALAFYALTLIPVAGVKVVAPAYYARNDLWTPVRGAFWALLVNLAASLVLMGPMKHCGLALAGTLSNAFNLVYLMVHLRAGVGPMPYRALVASLGRMVAAAGVMAAVVGLPARSVPWHGERVFAAAALAGLIAAGACAYFVTAHAVGIPDSSRLWRAAKRKVRVRGP